MYRLYTLINFSPEAVLESLLGLLQLLLVLEAIQVSENPHHLGKPMHLQHQSIYLHFLSLGLLEGIHVACQTRPTVNRSTYVKPRSKVSDPSACQITHINCVQQAPVSTT